MSNSILDRIKRGNSKLKPRTLLSGPEGIGKSTFAAQSPVPVFIAPEDGLTGLDYVDRFIPESLDDLHLLLDSFIVEIKFQTIVIDTMDWLERLITTSICKTNEKKNIEEFGYGKGYVLLENELVKILAKLDVIRSKHNVGIVMLAHVQLRTFNDPRGISYDRYEMKGNKKFTGVLREWPDACLFAIFEVVKAKIGKDENENAKAGDRVVHTQWSPAWDAKNRLNLPETIKLDWAEYETAIKDNSSATLIAQVHDAFKLATKLSKDDKLKWEVVMKRLDTFTPDRLRDAIKKLETLK
jgi:hypothetical protein